MHNAHDLAAELAVDDRPLRNKGEFVALLDSPHGSRVGLGLSMVNEIVTRHGGDVELSSFPGKGSTFAMRWRDMRLSNSLREYVHLAERP